MRSKKLGIAGLLVVVLGLAAWRACRAGAGSEVLPRPRPGAPATALAPSVAPRAGNEPATQREPHVERGAPEPEVAEPPGEPAALRSPLARHVDEVAASFLTEQPRTLELLGLVQDLAERAVVDPASLQIERDEEGLLRFVRGELAVGDLRGSFLLEEDEYSIAFRAPVAQEPWSERTFQITFKERQSAVSIAHATVQFHPRADGQLGPVAEEKIVGWGIGVSPEEGGRAIPITVRARGDAWEIGDGSSVPAQELPWIRNTAGFDVWLRLLGAYRD